MDCSDYRVRRYFGCMKRCSPGLRISGRGTMVHQQYPVLLLTGIVAAGLACSADSSKAAAGQHSTAGGTAPCKPLEPREPNAADQHPAFPGQTRACEDK